MRRAERESRRAAARLGFTFEGMFRQAIVYKGRNRDTAWYSIIDSEWPTVREAFERWLDRDNFDASGLQRSSLGDIRACPAAALGGRLRRVRRAAGTCPWCANAVSAAETSTSSMIAPNGNPLEPRGHRSGQEQQHRDQPARRDPDQTRCFRLPCEPQHHVSHRDRSIRRQPPSPPRHASPSSPTGPSSSRASGRRSSSPRR